MRWRRLLALLGGVVLLLGACGQPGGGTPPVSVAPPTNLTALGLDGQVLLEWEASTDDDIDKYNIYQGTTEGDLTKVADVNASTLEYTVTGLDNGTEYFFAVNAENDKGKVSSRTAVVSATPEEIDVATPPVVRSTSPSNGQTGVGTNVNITVTFSKPMDELSAEGAFSVVPAVNCDFSWKGAGTRLTCSPIGGLDPDQVYAVTVDTGAMDRDFNQMEDDWEFGFTTGSGTFSVCEFGTAIFGGCTFAP